jgi:hypothetical protein
VEAPQDGLRGVVPDKVVERGELRHAQLLDEIARPSVDATMPRQAVSIVGVLVWLGGVMGCGAYPAAHDACGWFDDDVAIDQRGTGEMVVGCDGMIGAHGGTTIVAYRDGWHDSTSGRAIKAVHNSSSTLSWRTAPG